MTEKNSSFYIHWGSFFLGLFLGILGFIISLFLPNHRRDRIYSSLLGWFLGTAVTMILFHKEIAEMMQQGHS
jgi:hypothetical protein